MKIQNQVNKIEHEIQKLVEIALSGEVQEHEAYAHIKDADLEGYLKSALSEIQSAAIDRLQQNYIEPGKKSYKDQQFVYTVRQGSTRYYFTDVEEVKEAKYSAENTEEFKKFKSAENKYKTAFLMKQKGQVLVDEETGEIVDPSDVKVVYSRDSISIKKI